MRVEVTVRTEDGQTHVIRRGRHEGKTFVSLDGVLMTQERFAERFGSRDLILSLLNPLYFAEVLGGDLSLIHIFAERCATAPRSIASCGKEDISIA